MHVQPNLDVGLRSETMATIYLLASFVRNDGGWVEAADHIGIVV